MTDRAAGDVPAWAPIRWSEFPVAFRGPPDQWPEPHRPSARRIFWWRAAAIIVGLAIVGLAVYRGASPPGDDGPYSLDVVSLSYAALLSVLLVPVTWVVAGWSYVKQSDPINEVLQKTRTARREMRGALRRGDPVPVDRQPLMHLWITGARAETRRAHWVGYPYAVQLTTVPNPAWFTVVWLVLTSLLLLLLVFGVGREMAFRYWESGVAREFTNRPRARPGSTESATRPTGTADGG